MIFYLYFYSNERWEINKEISNIMRTDGTNGFETRRREKKFLLLWSTHWWKHNGKQIINFANRSRKKDIIWTTEKQCIDSLKEISKIYRDARCWVNEIFKKKLKRWREKKHRAAQQLTKNIPYRNHLRWRRYYCYYQIKYKTLILWFICENIRKRIWKLSSSQRFSYFCWDRYCPCSR